MSDAPEIVQVLVGIVGAEVAYVCFLLSMRLSQVYADDNEDDGVYISAAGACVCWVLMAMCIRFGSGFDWLGWL